MEKRQQRPRKRKSAQRWTRRKRSTGKPQASMASPLLSFGLITDVQYADVEDGWNYSRTDRRFYRGALVLLREAIHEWITCTEREEVDANGTKWKKPIKFAVDLGDLIDGKNRGAGTTRAALADVQAACRVFEERVGPVHHLLGNHELYNMSQSEFERQLTWPQSQKAYYDFTVPEYAPHARFIVLNCYGFSSLGRHDTPDDPIFQEARRRLREVNKNSDLNSPLGLERDQTRFVEYNGAIDNEQLVWLQATLQKSMENREDVILFTHIPVHPKSCPWNCLLWNYEEVLATILDAASCVRVVFSGHVHCDGYAQEKGVHFVVNDAILECDLSKGETAHAIVDLHDDRLVINGYGKVPTRELKFPKRVEASVVCRQ